MYGLKEETDVSFLKGRELIQVAVGCYQIIFAFDEETTISVESGYELHANEGTTVWTPGKVHTAASALDLLGRTITEVRGEVSGTLTITFSGGDLLVISDSSKHYESYQITKPGCTIVV